MLNLNNAAYSKFLNARSMFDVKQYKTGGHDSENLINHYYHNTCTGWALVNFSEDELHKIMNSKSKMSFPKGTVYSNRYFINPLITVNEDGNTVLEFNRDSVRSGTNRYGVKSSKSATTGEVEAHAMTEKAGGINYLVYLDHFEYIGTDGSIHNITPKVLAALTVGLPGSGAEVILNKVSGFESGEQIALFGMGDSAVKVTVTIPENVISPYDEQWY